jgi:integrase
MTPTRYEGVYFRINRKKKKTFVARFTVNGTKYKRVIGYEPDINAKVASTLRENMINEVKRGLTSHSKTIDELFNQYVETRRTSLSHSWYYNITRNYEKHLRSAIGKKYPTQVTELEIQTIIDNMLLGNNPKNRKYKPSTVKQIKDCISGLYTYLPKINIECENIGHRLIIPKFDNKIYFSISDTQAKKLFQVILNYDDTKWRAYFIWLLHGRRKMEVASMRSEWLDFDKMVYQVPYDNNKSKKMIIAPMTLLLKDALEALDLDPTGYIFKGNGSTGYISSTGIDFQWRNIRALAGLPKMRLHDIRHLIGFMGVNSGYSLEQIGSVLGHSSTATTRRYSNMKSDSAKAVLSNMFDRFIDT